MTFSKIIFYFKILLSNAVLLVQYPSVVIFSYLFSPLPPRFQRVSKKRKVKSSSKGYRRQKFKLQLKFSIEDSWCKNGKAGKFCVFFISEVFIR